MWWRKWVSACLLLKWSSQGRRLFVASSLTTTVLCASSKILGNTRIKEKNCKQTNYLSPVNCCNKVLNVPTTEERIVSTQLFVTLRIRNKVKEQKPERNIRYVEHLKRCKQIKHYVLKTWKLGLREEESRDFSNLWRVWDCGWPTVGPTHLSQLLAAAWRHPLPGCKPRHFIYSTQS